jgi:hypothetical protein
LSPLEDRGLAVWAKVVVTGSPEVLVVAGFAAAGKNNSPQPDCSGDADDDIVRSFKFILKVGVEDSIVNALYG